MTQYIRTACIPDFITLSQVCQCSYHNERIFEIFYDTLNRRVLVQEFNNYFWLTSPDTDNITVLQVLDALGYANENIIVTWSDNQPDYTVLNSPVEQAPISQLNIYATNQPIHQQEPMPEIIISTSPIVPNEDYFNVFQSFEELANSPLSLIDIIDSY